MSMRSYRNLDEFIEEWGVLEPKPPDIRTFAFLLYSDLSKNIVGYVEEFCLILDEMTGPDFIVFVINQLMSTDLAYRKGISKPKVLYHVDPLLLQKDSVYRVVAHLNLDPEDIPSIVFFQHIEDEDIVVYPLEDSWSYERLTKEMKGIASDVTRAVRAAKKELGDSSELADWKRVKENFWKDLKNRITKRRRKAKGVRAAITIGSYLKSLREIVG